MSDQRSPNFASGIPSEFQKVTFEKEREKILSDLYTKSIQLSGLTDDRRELLFKVKTLDGENLVLEFAEPTVKGVKPGQALQVVFGLADGLFLFLTKADRVEGGRIHAKVGPELYKMQRRNNFRALVPPDANVVFRVASFNTQTFPKKELSGVDLSAGGIRLRWNSGLPQPKVEDQLSGWLRLPTGKELELFGTIRTVFVRDGDIDVGVEFQNLSIRDEQTLLFICMQMLRGQTPAAR